LADASKGNAPAGRLLLELHYRSRALLPVRREGLAATRENATAARRSGNNGLALLGAVTGSSRIAALNWEDAPAARRSGNNGGAGPRVVTGSLDVAG